jgi:hypothetical protein
MIPMEARPILTGSEPTRPRFKVDDVQVDTAVPMRARDGNKLVADIYRPKGAGRLPTIVTRTPYGRDKQSPTMLALAQHGYAAVAQDCRGTGASEPNHWDMYVYEPEDSYDTVEWLTQQTWYDGGIGGVGGSYVGETQWFMSMHPAMTAIAPEVAGIGGLPMSGVRHHMFVNSYIRTVGKGETKVAVDSAVMERDMLPQTWATGYFDKPLRPDAPPRLFQRYPELEALDADERHAEMWRRYVGMPPKERADLLKFLLDAPEVNFYNFGDVPPVFGAVGATPAFKYVKPSIPELYRELHAPALMLTGWYDWGLNRAFHTWELIQRHARDAVRTGSRFVIGPSAHNVPGYRDGSENPELRRTYRGIDNLELLLHWYGHWLRREPGALDGLSRVSYFLMGANVWDGADAWPPPDAKPTEFFFHAGGVLSQEPPAESDPDSYVYDPKDPTPTKGGSILSAVVTPGSADVSEVQRRSDVLVYTTAPLPSPLRIVGNLKAVLHATTTAVDTDFVVRLSDVHPDGRALQIQSGILRLRFRHPDAPALVEPGRLYRFEVDMWMTAHQFAAGHRLRIDVASADFPRFERNSNRGGSGGQPIPARQTIFHDPERSSHVVLPVAR